MKERIVNRAIGSLFFGAVPGSTVRPAVAGGTGVDRRAEEVVEDR